MHRPDPLIDITSVHVLQLQTEVLHQQRVAPEKGKKHITEGGFGGLKETQLKNLTQEEGALADPCADQGWGRRATTPQQQRLDQLHPTTLVLPGALTWLLAFHPTAFNSLLGPKDSILGEIFR